MRNPIIYTLSALILSVGPTASAEVVKLPDQPAHVVMDDNAPIRGMTKAVVSRKFGLPENQSGPVGDPPIYRWDYADYSVFFEGDYVLHSVYHSK